MLNNTKNPTNMIAESILINKIGVNELRSAGIEVYKNKIVRRSEFLKEIYENPEKVKEPEFIEMDRLNDEKIASIESLISNTTDVQEKERLNKLLDLLKKKK